MNDHLEYMTFEEIESLKKLNRNSYITGSIGSIMLYIVIHIFYAVTTNNIDKLIIPGFEILLIFGLPLIFFLLTYLLSNQLRNEISSGQKLIRYKKIQEKYDFMDKEDRFSPEKRKFMIVVNDQKYSIPESDYKYAQVGDLLELHLSPLRLDILQKRIIKNS